MNKHFRWRTVWLGCAAVSAAAAALARIWQMNTAFEAPLGLAVPFAQASVTLVCVLAISAAVMGVAAVRQPLVPPAPAEGQGPCWARALLDRDDRVFPVLLVSAGFLALGAAPVMFLQGVEQNRLSRELLAQRQQPVDNGVLMMAAAAAALVAFFGLLQMGRDGLRPGRRSQGSFAAALPGAAQCVWLMEHFRSSAADPVLWHYVPQLFAIIFGMMFYMDYAGMSAAPAHPRRLLWLAGMTAVFSAAAAAGLPAPGDLLLLGAQALAALAVLWRLPPNLEAPPAADLPCRPAQPSTQEEESTHE